MLCGSLDGKRVSRRMDIGVWMAEPLSCPPETISTLLINYVCVCARSLQPCPTLCHPMDWSPPGSSVHGILQAKIPEWVGLLAIFQHKIKSLKKKGTWGEYKVDATFLEGNVRCIWSKHSLLTRNPTSRNLHQRDSHMCMQKISTKRVKRVFG